MAMSIRATSGCSSITGFTACSPVVGLPYNDEILLVLQKLTSALAQKYMIVSEQNGDPVHEILSAVAFLHFYPMLPHYGKEGNSCWQQHWMGR
jgi:hypothetical protein